MSIIAREVSRLNALVNLHDYDVVAVSTSGGKDSAATQAIMVALADAQGFDRSKLVLIHSDLGRMEWEGSWTLIQEQAQLHGLRVEKVVRPQGDLFQAVEDRANSLYTKWLRARARLNTTAPAPQTKREAGKVVELADSKLRDTTSAPPWFSSATRYCTSDHKRGQIFKVFTSLADEFRPAGEKATKILDVVGLRAEESPARAKKDEFGLRKDASNGKRRVTQLLPILSLSTDEVWKVHEEAGMPHHRAYDLGMPRLSCVFCCFSPKKGLLLAGYHNPTKLALAVEVEARVGWSFKQDVSFAQVAAEIEAGWEPTGAVTLEEWEETGAKKLPVAA